MNKKILALVLVVVMILSMFPVMASACSPQLTVVKEVTSGPGPYKVGDTINYTVTITNTGDVMIFDIKVVEDPKFNVSVAPFRLWPGGSHNSKIITYSYVVQEGDRINHKVDNTVSVTGKTLSWDMWNIREGWKDRSDWDDKDDWKNWRDNDNKPDCMHWTWNDYGPITATASVPVVDSTGDFTVYKTIVDGNQEPISGEGFDFKLEINEPQIPEPTGVPSAPALLLGPMTFHWVDYMTGTTNVDGVLVFEDLTLGEWYRLTETGPSGYTNNLGDGYIFYYGNDGSVYPEMGMPVIGLTEVNDQIGLKPMKDVENYPIPTPVPTSVPVPTSIPQQPGFTPVGAPPVEEIVTEPAPQAAPIVEESLDLPAPVEIVAPVVPETAPNPETIFTDITPQAPPVLPKTGGIPMMILTGLGALLSSGGLVIRRGKRN